jgi:aminopeptidase N
MIVKLRRYSRPRLALLMAPLFLCGGECVPAQSVACWHRPSVDTETASNQQWDMIRLDLDVELCPYHGRLHGKGTGTLRLIHGPSFGPTLALDHVSGFTQFSAHVGDRGTVEVAPHWAQARFPEPLQPGDEVEVTFEFQGGGNSCPLVVGSGSAYARCHESWYPKPLVGSAVAPGTTRINVPSGWQTLSNGQLVESHVAGDRRIDTWHTEVPAARSFAAGPYSVRRFTIDGRSVAVFLLHDDGAKAETYGQGAARVLQALEARFGPYPYDTCSIVEIAEDAAAWKAASENGLILVASSVLRPDGFNLAVVAHELAHNWWGNYVGSRNPAALMVDEALAQYGIVLAIEALEGEQAATEFLRFSRDGYLPCECARAYFNRIRGQEHDKPLMRLTGEGYDYWLANAKGHWVHHMLRRRLGDELFFGTLRNLIKEYGGREMSLADLREAFLEAAPPEAALDDFFQQWLDRPGAPVLDVEWSPAYEEDRPVARVTIRQRGRPYDLELEVAVDSGDKTELHSIKVSSNEETFLLTSPDTPTGVRIDPNHRLLLWAPEYGPEP